MCLDGAQELEAGAKACAMSMNMDRIFIADGGMFGGLTETMSRLLYAYQLRSAPL